MILWRRLLKSACLPAAILLLAGLSLIPGGRAQGGISAPAVGTATVPLVTMTVRPNGCTVHVVGAGQTLWAIALAYGVKVDDIRKMNGIGAEDVTIYVGQALVIRCMPLTPTIEPTLSPTAGKVTRTATRVPASPKRTTALASTQPVAPTAEKTGEQGAPGALFAGTVILIIGTLLVLLVFGFVRRR
jgi:hypothetical protein